MANEAYVAEKVAEAAKNPKALLLGAIGAMSSTPTNSANVAEKELGFSKEEIQKARWVTLFRKGKTDLEFLKGLLEIINKKEEKMPTDRVAEVLNIINGLSLEERNELAKKLGVGVILEQKGSRPTLTPGEKIVKILEEAERRTRAGELEWSFNLDGYCDFFTITHKATMDFFCIVIEQHNLGYSLKITTPNGGLLEKGLGIFSKERKIAKNIQRLVDGRRHAARKKETIAAERKVVET